MRRRMGMNKRLVVVQVVALFLALAPLLVLPSHATSTVVSIADTFMVTGGTASTHIMIHNVSYLGVADITLTFDPSVVHIVSLTASDFDLLLPVINNTAGTARLGGMDYGDGLYGNVTVAEVTVKAVGDHGELSGLNLSINELKEAGPEEIAIPATVDNGTAFINLPPVAIAATVHRYNNIGSMYPCSVLFSASASYDPDGDAITNYAWDFGDGHSGEGLHVEHGYSSSRWTGTYEPFEVSLTAEDEWGLIDTVFMPVHVFIAGDANGDGVVDIFDGVIVGLEWDTHCTGYGWSTDRSDQADLNNDCVIDIFDGVIVGANWDHLAG
ncbi:MAG: PKD domain-containing protein [Methanophagales archaeon ANME-1-THS]|nr:MAG: PKD domain-containing protein [Methanophagales archaeon ANME-1-THS]